MFSPRWGTLALLFRVAGAVWQMRVTLVRFRRRRCHAAVFSLFFQFCGFTPAYYAAAVLLHATVYHTRLEAAGAAQKAVRACRKAAEP